MLACDKRSGYPGYRTLREAVVASSSGDTLRLGSGIWRGAVIVQHELAIAPAIQRMILCPDCGNKRCPKATLHTNACTGSNEPGQPGSRYGGPR